MPFAHISTQAEMGREDEPRESNGTQETTGHGIPTTLLPSSNYVAHEQRCAQTNSILRDEGMHSCQNRNVACTDLDPSSGHNQVRDSPHATCCVLQKPVHVLTAGVICVRPEQASVYNTTMPFPDRRY